VKMTARPALSDFTLNGNDGRSVRLSELFGDKHHLIVLHNMGEDCPNCALWGDEFNGMLAHLQRAAAFCIVGPDEPATQKAYAQRRGWQTPLYSAHGARFIKELGFERNDGNKTLHLIAQVHVPCDKRAPSVLEVLWMLPQVEVEDLAGQGDKQGYSEARVS
jgi:predicted dithiol-disulfide oxidoreductase (DUF899 family)